MALASVIVCCSDAAVVASWVIAALGLAPWPFARPASSHVSEPQLIWQVHGDGQGTPTADHATAYFLSRRHEVTAVDVATGSVKWRGLTGERGATTAGSLIVSAVRTVIAGDYSIVGFDRDGNERWRFAPSDGYGPGLYLGDTSGDMVFAGSASGRLHAIDAASGTERWSLQLGTDDHTTVFAPASDHDLIFAGFTSFGARSSGGVAAVEAVSGRERWRWAFPDLDGISTGAGLSGGPLVAGDLVLAVNRDGTIHAIDRASGRSLWSLPPVITRAPLRGGQTMHDFRALACSDEIVFAGSLTGTVVAYDLRTRRERWRQTPFDSSVAFGIASDRHSVYVPYLSGRMVALDAATGAERWRTPRGLTGLSWKPFVSGDRLYAAGSSGLVAFHP